MSKFRTKKDDRTTYYYRDAYGRKIEIAPGMEGCDGQAVNDEGQAKLKGTSKSVPKRQRRGYRAVSTTSVKHGSRTERRRFA